MKRLALLSTYFPPGNVAGVHRARLWSQYLPEFGWEPTIVTTQSRYYEEPLDPALIALVPSDAKVIYTRALPSRPIRLVGDLGIRALWWHYRALCALASRQQVDFLLITVASHYSSVLGRMIHRRFGIPYGIDYQDPWLGDPTRRRPMLSKAWADQKLAGVLEPWAVRDAALITGVAPGYFAGVLERNPEIARHAVTAAMPIGGSDRDFEIVRSAPPAPFLFDPDDGHCHLIYAGALLPAGVSIAQSFLQGLARLRSTAPATAARLRVHFVGTGRSAGDAQGHQILPMARRIGVEAMVTEHPHRIGYVDTLNHLMRASGVLVLGSTERHYTPSKLFLAVLSRRPVLAFLHEASTAVGMLAAARAGRAVVLPEGSLPDPAVVADELRRLVERSDYDPRAVDWSTFDAYSARNSARLLAAALDRACPQPAGKLHWHRKNSYSH
jgi:hypothetical protein